MSSSKLPDLNSTPASLLMRIRSSEDTEAWRAFEEIYTPIIRLYCGQRGLQAADIDDIAQEVMAAVATSISDFDYQPQRGRFRNWLGVITRNEIANFRNKHSKRGKELTLGVFEHEDSSTNDSDWVTIFSGHIFRVACERVRPYFEPKTWDCFCAAWIERQPASDIAQRLGIPVHSVYVNKSRVLKRLEQEVRMLADDYPITIH